MTTYTHQDFLDILAEIDEGDFEVTDFEATFIEQNLSARSFTLKQKKFISKLEESYLA